ncbi:MAG: HAD-IA family hydrolase [Solimonas sp.]
MTIARHLDALATPRAVLFDLDGTLADTAPDLGHAANLVRAELGLPALPLADYRPVASAGARGLLGKALGITPEQADYPARAQRFLALYREHLVHHTMLFAGIDELLGVIAVRGLAWGIVTNKPAWLTDPLVAGLKLRAACVVSADQVARPKPAPDALLRACDLLCLPPQACWYVGDDRRDIVAAQAAGMPSIAADWGYLGGDEPITAWGAWHIARTPQELAAWLRAAP